MKLTHVELRNWRNFAHIEFDLNTRLFVVGPNASGKSNLLDALRFISDVANAGLYEASTKKRDNFQSIVHGDAEGCSLAFRFDNSVMQGYELSLNKVYAPIIYEGEEVGEELADVSAVEAEHIITADGAVRLPPQVSHLWGQDMADPYETTLQSATRSTSFKSIRDYFVGIHYIHPNPKKMLERGRYDEHATGFTQRVASRPDAVLKPAIARIRPILASIVPEIPRLSYVRIGANDDIIFYSDDPQKPGAFTHMRFSEGTLRILGILFELATLPKDTSLVLIEEPELFMQPSVVRSLPDFFAAVAADRNVQMIITTHSPDLIDNELIRPDQVLMLEPTDTGTKGTLLSESQDPRVRSFVETGFPLSDAVDSVNRRRIPLGIWERR